MATATRFAGTTGHPVGEEKTGLAVGMDKGMIVTKRALKPKPSYRKGVRLRPHASAWRPAAWSLCGQGRVLNDSPPGRAACA